MELIFHTENPIGYGSLFSDEARESFTLYVKQSGFLPRLVETEDIEEVRETLLNKRLMTPGEFDRRFDAETPPVTLEGEEIEEPEEDLDDIEAEEAEDE